MVNIFHSNEIMAAHLMQRAMTNANQTSRDTHTHIHGTGHIQTGTGYTALAYSRF